MSAAVPQPAAPAAGAAAFVDAWLQRSDELSECLAAVRKVLVELQGEKEPARELALGQEARVLCDRMERLIQESETAQVNLPHMPLTWSQRHRLKRAQKQEAASLPELRRIVCLMWAAIRALSASAEPAAGGAQ
jgi:hypothetical protein